MSGQIRVLALCVLRQGKRILVRETQDPQDGRSFCRPLGGGVEFGETSLAAVRREMREELGVELAEVRLLGTLESLFSYAGRPGHEVVLVYAAEFVDRQLYAQTELPGQESDGEAFMATWRSLDSFDDSCRLVPEGLLALLASAA
ncbi:MULTISPECIES: NUDIX hydrolase [Pseudomonas]|jgi:ADP-ribose pyrophosphatase YjhB (NUDIX family)|uniref:NUDIX hydrolase n=1 Tax=Pseudomonas TaxID=286 RepID=UPI00165D5E7D|nr:MULTISPECIES: NUDIX domain-containing protein [Pseudomonas]MDK8266186.1 NUDIX domain-containing protein [Pseudomonas oryzihabitans]QNQ98029.1 NUDIX hydrolase [Pseudomonas psychrotolerans]